MEENKSLQWINVVLSEISDLEEETGRHIIEQCGRACAQSHGLPEEAQKIRSEIENTNDLDLLFTTYKEKAYNTPRLYTEEGVIYLEYHECGCPLVKSGHINNPFFCHCTRGYTKERFETLFGQPVRVELLQSMLQGDPICQQAIHVEENVCES